MERRIIDELRNNRSGKPGILCEGDLSFDGFAVLREWMKPEHAEERIRARHEYWRHVQIRDLEAVQEML